LAVVLAQAGSWEGWRLWILWQVILLQGELTIDIANVSLS
jgi:hypothetical protein